MVKKGADLYGKAQYCLFLCSVDKYGIFYRIIKIIIPKNNTIPISYDSSPRHSLRGGLNSSLEWDSRGLLPTSFYLLSPWSIIKNDTGGATQITPGIKFTIMALLRSGGQSSFDFVAFWTTLRPEDQGNTISQKCQSESFPFYSSFFLIFAQCCPASAWNENCSLAFQNIFLAFPEHQLVEKWLNLKIVDASIFRDHKPQLSFKGCESLIMADMPKLEELNLSKNSAKKMISGALLTKVATS